MEKFLLAFRDVIFFNLGPGPQLLALRHIINFYKAGTLFLCIYLMHLYNTPENTMINIIYTAMHGSYGLCWLLKDILFADPSFTHPGRFLNLLTLATVLNGYWLIPYWRITHPVQHTSSTLILIALLMYVMGVVIMMIADCQKYFILQNKKGLITYGIFSLTRNPNYLGEMMLYSAFALLCPDHRAWAILLFVWLSVFLMNMTLKEYSFSRRPTYPQYKKASHMLLPQLGPFKSLSYAIYSISIGSLIYFNKQ